MNRLDKESALAVVLANTRRKKRARDIITVAKALDDLVYRCRSQKAAAREANLSAEMVREFRKALSLPSRIRKLVQSRHLDRIDEVYRLSKMRDPAQQWAAAKRAAHMHTDEVRDVGRLVSEGRQSVEGAIVAVREARLRSMNIFIIEVGENEHRLILGLARQQRQPPAELVRQGLLAWLRAQGRTGKQV